MDPHTHVAADLSFDAAVRNIVASTTGSVGDLSAIVTTGCGLRVPRTNVSRVPQKVTCLSCREYASRRHRELAGQIERIGRIPGSNITDLDIQIAAQRCLDVSRQFDDPPPH